MSCKVCMWANHPPCDRHIPCCDCHEDCESRQCEYGSTIPEMPKPKTKVCIKCGCELPLEDYYVEKSAADGHKNECKHCYVERQQRKKFGKDHTTKHHTKLHKKTADERRLYQAEYMRRYREEHREKVREVCRRSIARIRAGEPKRKPGPPKGTKYHKQHNMPSRVSFVVEETPAVKLPRLCLQCVNYPCFEGIDNLESDFAREGCHGWKRKTS